MKQAWSNHKSGTDSNSKPLAEVHFGFDSDFNSDSVGAQCHYLKKTKNNITCFLNKAHCYLMSLPIDHLKLWETLSTRNALFDQTGNDVINAID